jgi:broad specificity phosphatase PhoE
MRRNSLPELGDWFRWSDGREFTPAEAKKMRFVLRRQERAKGETFRQFFERLRGVIEKYEAAQNSIIVKEPGVIRRAWNLLTGRANGVELKLGGK